MSENSETLKDRRQRLHLTQQELADLAGVKLSMVADIESGRQRPSDVTANRLERALREAEVEFKDKNVRETFVLARTSAGLSQEEVAKRAQIDTARYANWEAGIGGSLDDAVVLRIGKAIDAAGDEKERADEKKALAEGRGLPLSALASAGSLIERTYRRESRKEAERVFGVVNERLLREEVESLETMAAKVPGLEAENAALKAKIAELQKTVQGLKERRPRRKGHK